MIPSTNDILTEDLEIVSEPSLTYAMIFEPQYIIGTCDTKEAMKQAIFKILNTERYEYMIYSWDYGIELKDLYGEPLSYVCCELEDRITEALIQDDRIEDVSDFEFITENKNEILCTFTVHTIYGDIEAERTVNY